jgi:hypothetical protein
VALIQVCMDAVMSVSTHLLMHECMYGCVGMVGWIHDCMDTWMLGCKAACMHADIYDRISLVCM